MRAPTRIRHVVDHSSILIAAIARSRGALHFTFFIHPTKSSNDDANTKIDAINTDDINEKNIG